jgi:hypothetical protein
MVRRRARSVKERDVVASRDGMMEPMRRTTTSRRSAVLLCAVIAAVAGCASSAGSAAPSGPAGASPSTRAARSQAAATPGTSPATPRPSSSSNLVIPHENPALEALLPDEVDGARLTKLSVGPVSSVGNAGAQGVKDLAKRIGDGSNNFGLAYAGDPAGKFNLFLLKVDGADSSALLTNFAQMTLAETLGGKAQAANLGGRDLVHIIDPVSDIGDVWFYAKDDSLFGVQAGSPEDATKLLALLP